MLQMNWIDKKFNVKASKALLFNIYISQRQFISDVLKTGSQQHINLHHRKTKITYDETGLYASNLYVQRRKIVHKLCHNLLQKYNTRQKQHAEHMEWFMGSENFNVSTDKHRTAKNQ